MNLIYKFVQRLNREVPTESLVKRGLKVGKEFNRQQGVYIDPTHCYLIEIGDEVTMSVRVTLLAHDASTKKILGYTKLGKIRIGNYVFIGANATILPGVSIGNYAIIGAGSVVTHDIPENMLAAGCPAKVICSVDEYKQKEQALMEEGKNVFDGSYVMGNGLNREKTNQLRKEAEKGTIFIV